MEKINISKFNKSVVANSKLKAIIGGSPCTAEATCPGGYVISCSGSGSCSGTNNSGVSCGNESKVEPWPGAGFTVSAEPIVFGCPPTNIQ